MAPSAKAELTSDMVAKSKAFKEQYIHMFGTNKYTKRGPHSNAKLSRKNVVSRQILANRTLLPKDVINIGSSSSAANAAAANFRMQTNGRILNGYHRGQQLVALQQPVTNARIQVG